MDDFQQNLEQVKRKWENAGLVRRSGRNPVPKHKATSGILRKLSESSESSDESDDTTKFTLVIKYDGFENGMTVLYVQQEYSVADVKRYIFMVILCYIERNFNIFIKILIKYIYFLFFLNRNCHILIC